MNVRVLGPTTCAPSSGSPGVTDRNGRAAIQVGLLGGGVIGGGWAARFMLRGHDVRLYDPNPEAIAGVEQMLANARRAAGDCRTRRRRARGR